MKAVDITLIIQACNFFIAYYFLRTYIFSPAAHILQEQEDHDHQLQRAIDGALKKKDTARYQMKQRILQIKKLLLDRIPVAITTKLYDTSVQSKGADCEPKALSEKQSQTIKQMISDRITKVL